jgi:uncharacterized membrane protein
MQMIALIVLALALTVSCPGRAEDAKVNFVKVIKPILESTCVKCHGADRFHGEVRLDTRELALAAIGENGRLLVPGHPEKSTLYTTSVLPDTDPLAMPPRDRDGLSREQEELLRKWIKEGATWPEEIVLKRVDKVTFTTIGSLMQQNCLSCHSKKNAEGGLRLDTKEESLKGGKNGKVILPYNSAGSSIYRSLKSPSVHDKNPPRLLTEEDVKNMQAWLDQGAVWPDDMKLKAP